MSAPKARMSIAELLEAAERIVITEKDVAALNERLQEADKKFEAEARARAIDQEWLNRQYTI